MNTLDKKYTDLLQDILENRVEKNTRNGKIQETLARISVEEREWRPKWFKWTRNFN